MSITQKAEGILGLILQVAAVTITAALLLAGITYPQDVLYVLQSAWGRR